MKRISILGSAGSIGENAIRVANAVRDRFRVAGLAVEKNYRRVLEQAVECGAKHVAVADEGCANRCALEAPSGITVHRGVEGLKEVAALGGVDVVLCSVVGMAGLAPVMAAIAAGSDVALATKEVLVAAGSAVTDACARHRRRLIPVDSEHSAVFQCLCGHKPDDVDIAVPLRGRFGNLRRIILTASGGPFFSRCNVDFDAVTVDEALAHPTWSMGRKVSVDSATLMNKGLEIIEAAWLFGVDAGLVDVVVHPESIVHSMVEFCDGSMLAQLSMPDMRFAIQYALSYPERIDGGLPALDPVAAGKLTFESPDPVRFPCLALARRAGMQGGTMPAVLNAANHEAVSRFLDGAITFAGIWSIVERVMDRHEIVKDPCLEEIIEADRWASGEAAAIKAG